MVLRRNLAIQTVLALCLVFSAIGARSQDHDHDFIEVSFDKSVLLVFESNVKEKGWNCGAKELVGVSVTENKVLLQAKEEHFDETNLLVELQDGSYYAFILKYNNSPKKTFHPISSASAIYKNNQAQTVQEVVSTSTTVTPTVVKKDQPVQQKNEVKKEPVKNPVTTVPSAPGTNADAGDVARRIASEPDYLRRIGAISKKMMLYVGGIYIIDNKLYFKVHLKNESSIPYDIELSQFITKNSKASLKRHSFQAERKEEILVFNKESKRVESNQTVTFVYVFEKFAIDENKKLFIEFWEKNGDRSIELPIESSEILTAKSTL